MMMMGPLNSGPFFGVIVKLNTRDWCHTESEKTKEYFKNLQVD